MEGDLRSIDQRLAKLSASQRALLERRLLESRTKSAQQRAIPARDGDGPAPLSYAQELLWLLSQVFDDGVAYNAPGAFQLEGPLELELLRRSLEGLAERHSILRTTYSVIGGTPMQTVGEVQRVELNLIDLRHLPADEKHAESQRILQEESRFRFDLVTGPVMRPTVIRLAEDEHILMLNMHHIATDGYSRSVLYRDLTALYEAFSKGRPCPFEPLRIEYADYAVWQRRWLDEGVADAQLEYWKRKLARAPSRLDLPTDFPRPPVRSWVGDNMSVMLDLATREALRATAREGEATLFIALLATFGVLLSRYSDQSDIVIGTPFASRNRTELESMVGYFINPLALRLDLSGDPTFSELVARAKETTLEAFAHADMPYERVVREVNPERDLSQTPVFQAMVVFHNPAWQTERPKFEPEGIRCVEISHKKGWAKFDLLLGMSERTTGLNTSWEYSTELFKPATVQRMIEHFRALAESAGSSPDRRLSQLSMLSEAERAKVLVSWNAHPEPLPQRETVKELFEEQVLRTPSAPAVSFDGEQLTFDELNRRANRIAWLLRERGVGPGTFVGILMEKSLDLVPAVLGVVKAGGAYIPLDPLYPADRIEFMVADAQPKLLLTQVKHLGRAFDDAGRRVAVDAPGALDGLSEENPPTVAGGDDLAYVIYTSGSTGRPKGAMIANRSLASAYFAYERAYRLRELTAHAQMASFSFDVFTGDLIRSLLAGAKLVLCPIETVIDPAALHDLMLAEGIDAAEFVPATASLLFEYAEREGKTLEHMRLVVVSSEAWRNDKYAFFKGLCGPQTRLINAYGLTEATIDSTWFEPSAETELVPGRFVPIGRPLDNTRVYVLDSEFEPQPIGIPGELHVGGVAVARGYLNRPELTAEKFVPDPFSGEPGALLYRTGDLARWLPDGTIDFLGRTDRQIKIRGFRIEPGEIEAVLERLPAIRAAAVVGRRDPRGETRLVAYLDADRPPDSNDLHAFLSEHVPHYMIPSAYVRVDELPLTPNGKIDLDALPDPVWEAAGAAEELVAPRTETERRIADVWSGVLSVAEIGINDNFFALGGHSLLAMKVMSRLRDELGVTLLLRAIFDAPTVQELAAEIDRAETVSASVAPPTLARLQRAGPGPSGGRGFMQTEQTELTGAEAMFPASFAQQRMWFLEQLEGGAAYNVPVATRLRGALDVDALEGALSRLIERHESLRTVFTLVDDIPHQVIRPARAFSLNVIDLSGAEGAEARALQIASHQARAGFDLAAEEPFRVVLVKLGDEDHLLSLTLHHIVTDAWSIGVLTRELGELYTGLHAGEAVELPELEIQYADYAVWQQQWLDGGGLDRQLDYWRKQLSGAPALLELPTDRPRPSRQSFRGATSRMMLPLELMEQVRALGESTGATTFMTLLATFATLLSRYSGQQDVVVASPVANRSRTELEGVIGLFVNTLPLRVELTGDPSFSELLHRTREVALAAFSHQDLPFEKIVEKLAPERHPGHAPVSQVMLVVQSAVERPVTLPGLEQERVNTERNTAKFDLTLFAAETPEGLRLSLEYCTDLFDESTALRMLDHFRVLLEAAVADPARPVSELRLLSEAEQRLVLEEWNATDTSYPPDRDRPVHELFAEQAMRSPDVVAVECGDECLTFGELERRAALLARYLRGLGVGRDVLVGIALERSCELVVGLLGILKAGGAYVPIDPGYPVERQAYMLEDAAVGVLVTQERLLGRVPVGSARAVCIDRDWEEIAAQDDGSVEGGATLEDLAYVIYTSGSTGRPKGVEIPHRALANFLWAMRERPGLGPEDVLVAVTTLSFDIAGLELYLPLLVGGRVVIAPAQTSSDPRLLAALIAESSATVMQATPTTWRMLLDSGWRGRPGFRVLCGGEALPVSLAEELVACGFEVWNMYGPTETTIWSSVARVQRDEPLTIGRPIANTSLFILDSRLQPLPVGVAGELHIGGDGVARGYRNRPELTAERFLANPFGAGRIYKTGDLARYRPDGRVEFLGRLDHQVKVRGFRIELGEIETLLARNPGVARAVCVARDDGNGAELVAYIVPSAAPVSAAQLRRELSEQLPAYMVPSAIVSLQALPLTPNGKIDRAQLSRVPLSKQELESPLTPPRTETERQLVAIWKKVLAVDEIGVHDNFFELGGHSLLAVRVFAEIERKLGIRLPLSALFDTATIAGLAELIELERSLETEWPTLVRLRSGAGQLPLFLISWADGEVLPYRDLVKNLDLDLPVFGLQAPGTDRRTLPFGTIEELAAHYLEEIRRIQPHGPYRFGGFCFSGLVAYEMARQLEARGENTSTLALIEAYADRPHQRRRRRTLEARRAQLNAFREAGPASRGEWVRSRIAGRVRRGVYFKGGPRLYELLTAHNLQRLIPHRRLNVVLIASNLARMRYVPKPSDVRVQFFRAQHAADPHPTPWDNLATRGVDVRPIVAPDIDHANMMYEPHVQLLAEELMRHLNGGANGATSSNGAVTHPAD